MAKSIRNDLEKQFDRHFSCYPISGQKLKSKLNICEMCKVLVWYKLNLCSLFVWKLLTELLLGYSPIHRLYTWEAKRFLTIMGCQSWSHMGIELTYYALLNDNLFYFAAATLHGVISKSSGSAERRRRFPLCWKRPDKITWSKIVNLHIHESPCPVPSPRVELSLTNCLLIGALK